MSSDTEATFEHCARCNQFTIGPCTCPEKIVEDGPVVEPKAEKKSKSDK